MCDRPTQALISESMHVKHGVIRAYEIGEARSAEVIKCRRTLILLEFSKIEKRITLLNCIAVCADEGIALMGAVGVAQDTSTTGDAKDKEMTVMRAVGVAQQATTTSAAQDDDIAAGEVKTHCKRRSEDFSVTPDSLNGSEPFTHKCHCCIA